MVGSTNARKKGLTTTLQVRHLLPQSLNACINGVNSKLNLLYEEGSGSLMKMVQNELYSKAHANKLLYHSSSLQDPLGRNDINKVVLDVVHHTPQQLQKVLSNRAAKTESLHEVTTAAIDYLQVRSTILKNSKAMEVNIGRPRTPEVRRIEVINLMLIKTSKEGCGLTYRV